MISRTFFSQLLTVALVAFGVWSAPLQAQELRVHPTPFSVWLDFQRAGAATKGALPIWMESLQRNFTPAKGDIPDHTNFRIRLRRLGHLNSEVQLRLFFHDQKGRSPIVTGWTETGRRLYNSEPLGVGIDLPSSQTLTIPVADLDYLDIDVPGDGHSIRGAFVATLQKYEARHPLDFEPLARVGDPFSPLPAATLSKDDSYFLGRVKAGLDAEPMKLVPRETPRGNLHFDLASAPLLAIISFEVLNVDPVYPPELTLNDRPLGRVALLLPDLADPGYQGAVRPLQKDMRFRYTGWVRCQQVVSGSDLLTGLNKLIFALNRESGPLAVRSVQIELKYPSQSLDYELLP